MSKIGDGFNEIPLFVSDGTCKRAIAIAEGYQKTEQQAEVDSQPAAKESDVAKAGKPDIDKSVIVDKKTTSSYRTYGALPMEWMRIQSQVRPGGIAYENFRTKEVSEIHPHDPVYLKRKKEKEKEEKQRLKAIAIQNRQADKQLDAPLGTTEGSEVSYKDYGPLPPGWTRVPSRTRPGQISYEHRRFAGQWIVSHRHPLDPVFLEREKEKEMEKLAGEENPSNHHGRMVSMPRPTVEPRGQASGGADCDLPPGWVAVPSRSRPGEMSYKNEMTREVLTVHPMEWTGISDPAFLKWKQEKMDKVEEARSRVVKEGTEGRAPQEVCSEERESQSPKAAMSRATSMYSVFSAKSKIIDTESSRRSLDVVPSSDRSVVSHASASLFSRVSAGSSVSPVKVGASIDEAAVDKYNKADSNSRANHDHEVSISIQDWLEEVRDGNADRFAKAFNRNNITSVRALRELDAADFLLLRKRLKKRRKNTSAKLSELLDALDDMREGSNSVEQRIAEKRKKDKVVEPREVFDEEDEEKEKDSGGGEDENEKEDKEEDEVEEAESSRVSSRRTFEDIEDGPIEDWLEEVRDGNSDRFAKAFIRSKVTNVQALRALDDLGLLQLKKRLKKRRTNTSAKLAELLDALEVMHEGSRSTERRNMMEDKFEGDEDDEDDESVDEDDEDEDGNLGMNGDGENDPGIYLLPFDAREDEGEMVSTEESRRYWVLEIRRPGGERAHRGEGMLVWFSEDSVIGVPESAAEDKDAFVRFLEYRKDESEIREGKHGQTIPRMEAYFMYEFNHLSKSIQYGRKYSGRPGNNLPTRNNPVFIPKSSAGYFTCAVCLDIPPGTTPHFTLSACYVGDTPLFGMEPNLYRKLRWLLFVGLILSTTAIVLTTGASRRIAIYIYFFASLVIALSEAHALYVSIYSNPLCL